MDDVVKDTVEYNGAMIAKPRPGIHDEFLHRVWSMPTRALAPTR